MNTHQDTDWRLTDQEDYLKGIKLFWREYTPYKENWDHDHCSFCWDKFMVEEYSDVLTEGYATEDNYYWICPTCFEDFKEQFQWKVIRPKGSS